MPVRLLLLILLLPLPLIPAEGPAQAPAASAPAPAPGAAKPVFTDAEWQRGQAAGSAPADGGGVVGKAAVGLLASLAVIALIAGGLAYAVRKLGMRRVLPGRGRHLTVIETVPLGFKRSLSLVRIGDQVLVVGLGEHELSHMATLPLGVLDHVPAPADQAASGVAAAAPPAPPASAFRAVLDSVVGRRA